jgi:hypothetical protein
MFRKFLGYLLFLLPIQELQAQVWPTQVNTIIVPPYSPFTGDYVNTPGKMIVNLLLRDINASNVKVKLRINIEGQGSGVKLTTNPQANVPVLTLDGGIPLRLSDADLAPYFRVENLLCSGITPAQYNNSGGKLPEDLYKICFEAYELFTGSRISVSNGCGNAWIILNDPPFLNTPTNNVKVPVRNPGVVNFQWTPRHKGSPNAAFSTAYLFQLVELMPGSNTNPQAAFLASIPLYETTVSNTMLTYGMMGEVPLEPGRQYAWRIKAKSISGVQEMDLFKNQGFSEIFTFTYAGNCPVPTGITAKANGNTRIDINWTGTQSEYVVSYRKAVANSSWFEEKTNATSLTIYDLEPATSYEYRVRANCGNEGESAFSETATIATPAVTPVDYVCGTISPENSITNMNPLPLLKARDMISAGLFNVKLIKVTGSNGTFSGTGYITIPYLHNSRIEVSFTNIFVNTDYKLAKGEIVTAYDPKWSGVNDLDKYFEGGGKTGQVGTGTDAADITVDVVIAGPSAIKAVVTPGKPTVITITGADKTVITKTVTELPVTIKDKDGNIYKVDEKGAVSQIAEGAASFLPDAGERNTLHPDKAIVSFIAHPNQVYAFDAFKPEYLHSQLFSAAYEKLSDDYYVAAKSISAGKTDVVKAKIVVKEGVNPDEVKFVTGKGSSFVSKRLGDGTYEITVLGGPANDAQELYAVYKFPDGKTLTLGKLLIAAYENTTLKVKLVPVNGDPVNVDDISKTLQRVYGPVSINWQVSVDEAFTDTRWDLDGDGLLDVGSGGLLTSSTREMKELNRIYTEKHPADPNTAYLFILKNGKDKDKLLLGDMPREAQFGYLFTGPGGDIGKIAAHELGHGVFHLKHTFDDYGFADRDLADNLMNYRDGELLTKFQWDALHDPGVVWGLFESSSDGEQQAVHIKELLKFLKDNKGKIAAFDQKDYFRDDKGIYGQEAVLENEVLLGGKNVALYADVFGSGEVDQTKTEKGYFKYTHVGVSIPSLGETMMYGNTTKIPFENKYHTVFYVGYYYKDNTPAVQIYTHSYADYELLLTELGLDISAAKPAIIDLYKKAHVAAGNNCDKVDVIYESIPDFVLKECDDSLKWDALVSLSGCWVDEIKTNEEQAILNILRGFKNEDFLYKKLKDSAELVLTLWHQLDNKGFGAENSKAYANILLFMASKHFPASPQTRKEQFAYWGEGFKEWRRLTPVNDELVLHVSYDEKDDSLYVRSVFGSPNFMDPGTYQEGTIVSTFKCKIFDPVRLMFDEERAIIVPGVYLYHLGIGRNYQLFIDVLMTDLAVLGNVGALRILVTPGAPALLKIVAATQLVKIPIDKALSDKDVQREIRKLEGGDAFLGVWPIISTGMDVALISTDMLYTFMRSGPAVKAVLKSKNYSDAADDVKDVEDVIAAQLEQKVAAEAKAAGTAAEAEAIEAELKALQQERLAAEVKEVAIEAAAIEAKATVEVLGDVPFEMKSVRELVAQIPTGKGLTNIGKKMLADYALSIPMALKGKILPILDDIMRNGDLLGAKTEMIMDMLMDAKGFAKIEAKYHGVNGLDGLYIPKGQTLDNATEIIISESKQLKQTLLEEFDEITGTGYDAGSGLKLGAEDIKTGLPVQMSENWIKHVANAMMQESSEELQKVGEQLLKIMGPPRGNVMKVVTAVDKQTGAFYFLKLDSY